MTDRWTPAADQSSGVKVSDLQVAKGTGSTIRSFTMEHKMGLLTASISTSTTTVDNAITYDGNSWNGTTWTSSSRTTLSYYVSRTFTSSNKPYVASNTLYYIGKPSANDITLTTSATDSGSPLYYAWTLNNSSVTTTVVGSASTYKSLTIPAYSGKNFRQKVWNFSKSGTIKTWKAPQTGLYKMECWGASGGSNRGLVTDHGNVVDKNGKMDSGVGGFGGYSYGTKSLTSGNTLYVCVGGQGSQATKRKGGTGEQVIVSGGYNGGGNAKTWDNSGDNYMGSGGGGGWYGGATSTFGWGAGGGSGHLASSVSGNTYNGDNVKRLTNPGGNEGYCIISFTN